MSKTWWKIYTGLHVKHLSFLSDLNETWILDKFSKNTSISRNSILWESSCSMRTYVQADRQTDMTQLIVIFCNFENAPKKLEIPKKWHGLEFQGLLFYKFLYTWKFMEGNWNKNATRYFMFSLNSPSRIMHIHHCSY